MRIDMRIDMRRDMRIDMRIDTRQALTEQRWKALGRGGHFEYRHVYTGAVDTPSAMADVMPI